MNVFFRTTLAIPLFVLSNAMYAVTPGVLQQIQDASQSVSPGAINGVKIPMASLSGPAGTEVVVAGDSETKKFVDEINEIQPPQAQEKVKSDIQAAAQKDGTVEASKVDEILRKAKLEMAQEKLKELSKPAPNTNANSTGGAAGGSPSAGGHGGGSSGVATRSSETYLPRTNPIQKDINTYSNALADYSKTSAGLLSNKSLNSIQSSFIDFARNSIDMPRGKEKALSENVLFGSLGQDTQNSLKDSFLGLVKNSATGAAPADDLLYLKDIVGDSNFQSTAAKVLGPDNLSYLNLATISADILNVKGLTGAAYSAYLSLSEGTIAGGKASANVTEWMQAASFLSGKTFLDSVKDANFGTFMRAGYSELNNTYKKLAALKSLDFLDLLQNSKELKMKKILDAGVINSIAALRQAKRLKARVGWDPGILSNFNYFQQHIRETLEASARVTSSQELLVVYDKVLSNNSFRAYWRSFDYPGYFKFRRSVGSVYFAVKFRDFDKFRITPQTAPALTYRSVPKNYATSNNPMFFITATAMQYVKNQKEQSRRIAEQQRTDDKRYSVKQLAGDKYYINLEDETD
ncbi:MAG: hypothetical protein R3A80_09855 [Bdellovibrionota bacterium]